MKRQKIRNGISFDPRILMEEYHTFLSLLIFCSRSIVLESIFIYHKQIRWNYFKRFRTRSVYKRKRKNATERLIWCVLARERENRVHIKCEIDCVHWTDTWNPGRTNTHMHTRNTKKRKPNVQRKSFFLVWVDKTDLQGISWVPAT